jgi:hypothetical protein
MTTYIIDNGMEYSDHELYFVETWTNAYVMRLIALAGTNNEGGLVASADSVQWHNQALITPMTLECFVTMRFEPDEVDEVFELVDAEPKWIDIAKTAVRKIFQKRSKT